ncbi:MAG: hypothetical protein VR77_01155 [Flavobacteriales bacterium BRH_c54]|nr:MAG: hypothetical protein VR77_01155 [Flavobacteriales bacterium BRH_c54]
MFIHKLADVQSKKIGKDTKIWQFVVVLPKAIIGENCNICSNVFIENNVVIGNNVTIKNGVQIWDNITIKDEVFVGPNVTFTNDNYPKSKNYPQEYLKTIINTGASLGANTTIVGGVTIGKYSMIGAGSVVTKDVLPFGLYYGNPAILKGYITKNGVKLNLNLKDINGNEYEMVENELILKIK